MKIFISIFYFSLILLIKVITIQAEAMNNEAIKIIPAPKNVYEKKGLCELKDIILNFEKFRELNDLFKEEIKSEIEVKFKRQIEIAEGAPEKANVIIREISTIEKKHKLFSIIDVEKLIAKDEGYLLDVNRDKIEIYANSRTGAFYALMSLVQLIGKKPDGSIVIPCVTVVDYPEIKMRGISDDISRGQVSTLTDFKKIIRFLARYKMNTYYPYLEDMIEIKSYPEMGLNRGRLTQEEVRELVSYGQKYFVELIPVFQTLGHWENLLIKPEFYNLADFPGSASLDITNSESYQFIENCIKEIVSLFPSKYFHAGCDESWDVGQGNSKKLKESLGLGKIHLEHYKKVNEIIKKYGKQMMMYGDILHNHPEIFAELPKDILVVDWRYGVQDFEPYVRKYKDAGIPFLVSPSVTNYNRIFPWIENSVINIKEFTKTSFDNGAIGFINSNWGDNGGENFREYNWFGYAFGAECSWNVRNIDINSFKNNFFKDFYGGYESEFLAVYRMLSDFGVGMTQYELWRDPFLPYKENTLDAAIPPNLRASSMVSRAEAITSILDKLDNKEIINKYHLKYLRFAANQAKWYGDKLLTSKSIKERIDKKKGVLNKNEKDEIYDNCKRIINNLEKMKKEFTTLWMQTNRLENLEFILSEKYGRQTEAWNRLISRLNDDSVSYDSKIKSFWICHPEGEPGNKEKQQPAFSTFNYSLNLEAKPGDAQIHLMADTYGELYVNNKFVGDVRAKRTLSLIVESQRNKIFDINSYLLPGINDIKIKCTNYNKNGLAMINVQLKVDNELYHSSGKWLVEKGDNVYISSKEFPDNGTINEPDFLIKRASKRER